MINPRFIKKFLKRPTNSFDWIKSCGDAQLQTAFAELNPKPDFGEVKLWRHQKACFLLLEELQRFMLHIGMGGGKTLLTLLLLKYRKQRGEKPKAIVFVPYITSILTWVEEVEKHAPDLVAVPLCGSARSNHDLLHGGVGDLFIMCYQSGVAMLSIHQRKKWKLRAADVRSHFADFDMLVMDEIHKCKSVTSMTYRMCRAISAQSDWVLGLTGTPFSRDLTDLWPQFYLIDFGETLGETLSFYREVFFERKEGFFTRYNFRFRKKLLPALHTMIKHSSIHYDIKEFSDMPQKRLIPLKLSLPEDYRGYCEAAIRNINNAAKRKQAGDYAEVESNFMKLRQLASGFMTLKGQDDDKVQIKFFDNPKLDKLEELVDAMPLGHKMVVFHHYVYTSQMISERLTKLGVGHARVWGGQKNPIGELKRFKNSKKCQVLVLNYKSGSSSLNLQHANYMMMFELPDTAIDWQQAISRVWRPGQANRVFIYVPLMTDTADKRLYHANRHGEDLLRKLLTGENLWPSLRVKVK